MPYHWDEVTRIWKNYHLQLTGSSEVHYDEHGNLFGSIAKFQPTFQGEILDILYNEGYRAGVLSVAGIGGAV